MNKAVFKRKIENIMRENQNLKARDREKTGKINSKRLSRLETSPRLFKKRKLEKKGKDYFISILLDASGSMDGDRAEITLKSMKDLADSFNGIVGLHYEVVIFGTFEVKVKDYNEIYDHDKVKKVYYDVMNDGFMGLLLHHRNGSHIRRAIPFDTLLDIAYELDKQDSSLFKDNDYGNIRDYMIYGFVSDIYTLDVNSYSSDIYLNSSTALDKLFKTVLSRIGVTDTNLTNYDYISGMNGIGGTYYLPSVLNSYYRMEERTGKKMLLLITDGDERNYYSLPTRTSESFYIPNWFKNKNINDFNYGDQYRLFIEKEGRKHNIKTVCLGIQTEEDDVNHFSHYKIIHNLNDLFPTMIKIFNKVFVKG